MTEDIRGKEMDEIGTETLVRALTIDAEEYTEAFLERARAELGGRDIDVDAMRDRVSVLSPEGQKVCTLEEALADVRSAETWTFRVLEVATGDTLAVNAMAGCWSVRYRDATDAPVGVLAYRDVAELEAAIRPLLELNASWTKNARRFEDEKWEVLTTSNSIEHLVAVAEELAERDLMYTLRTASARELEASTWMSIRRDGAQLLIRPADWPAGERVMKAIDEEIEARLEEAERHAKSGNAEEELASYERVARLRPGDAMVHFNRAAILLDLGRREEFADAFMEAAPLLVRDEHLARYVPDVVEHLQDLATDYPKPQVVMHALASIALVSGDVDGARELYEKIVATDDGDAAAHAALGRILYEDGDRDAEAEKHLTRYLELEPHAPDRDGIEHTLAELREES